MKFTVFSITFKLGCKFNGIFGNRQNNACKWFHVVYGGVFLSFYPKKYCDENLKLSNLVNNEGKSAIIHIGLLNLTGGFEQSLKIYWPNL